MIKSAAIFTVGAALLAAVAASGPAGALSSRLAGTTAASPGSPARAGLRTVSAVGGTHDAWAVASAGGLGGTTPLLWYNGRKWATTSAKPPAKGGFSDVAAVSKTTAWISGVVGGGYYGGTPEPYLAKFARGSLRRWNLKRLGAGSLMSVSAISATDAWAVGQGQVTSSLVRPLALRWNGRSWKRVPVLGEKDGLSLTAVAVTGRTAAWATTVNAAGSSEVLRWNGKRWAVSFTPPGSIELDAVAASSPRNAWVVGLDLNATGSAAGYSAHWNGTNWHRVAMPGSILSLNAVTMSGSRTWAAGEAWPSSAAEGFPVMLYWTGGAWRRQKAPDPGAVSGHQSQFVGISAASAHFVIAAGDNNTDCGTGTGFTDVYRGGRWRAAAFPPLSASRGVSTCGG